VISSLDQIRQRLSAILRPPPRDFRRIAVNDARVRTYFLNNFARCYFALSGGSAADRVGNLTVHGELATVCEPKAE
jgi:hypothetical protein